MTRSTTRMTTGRACPCDRTVRTLRAMASKKYGAEEARTRLPELLEKAHRGTPTLITKHGRPYAMLVPVGQAGATRRGPSVTSLAGTGAGLWGRDSAGTIAALRDEWSR